MVRRWNQPSSRRGGGRQLPVPGEGWESSPSWFSWEPCRNAAVFEDSWSKNSSFPPSLPPAFLPSVWIHITHAEVKHLVKWNASQKPNVEVCNADKPTWASLHIFPRNRRNTLYTESFVSLFLSFSFHECFYSYFSVSRGIEGTTNLCSIWCFRKAKETNL